MTARVKCKANRGKPLEGETAVEFQLLFVYVRGRLVQASATVTPTKPGWFEISLSLSLYELRARA